MGRPKIKIMDDSQPEAEIKQKSKKKTFNKGAQAKVEEASRLSEAGEANSEVEQTTESVIASEAKQSSSEDNPIKIATSPTAPRNDEAKKPQKQGKSKPRSKKYKELTEDMDRTKIYPLSEAVDMVKKLSYAKFNATLEVHINTAQTGIRGLVSLPYAKGRQLRIICFGPSNLQMSKLFPTETEGIVFGSESDIEEINKGKIDFDLVITTPEWMSKLAKIARILGPRGLMPNPKNGTITSDLKKTVEGFQAGKTEYKTESKAPVIHIAMGKLEQPTEELVANIKTLLQTLGKTRVKKVTLSPTMGPSVKVDLKAV